jgi:uncharacterized protein (TIGR00290 family)
MSFALMSSGGKDSTLALDRARREGLDVRYLVNVYDGPSDRVAFHGTHRDLIAAQAAACELEHFAARTDPDHPYEPVLLRTLDDLKNKGVSGVVFGNIHLADVRQWYEDRVRDVGLEHVEPLWGDDPPDLLREVVERGFRAIVVSVDLQQGGADLLGMEIDRYFVTAVGRLPTIDVCGERGEYHSFVYDGPTFAHPVLTERGEIRSERDHRLLDLTLTPSA